jgi:IS5 family transposase
LFQYKFPYGRADLRHLRKRLEDKLELMLAESMGVAHEASALRSTDLARVAIDTPVQPKPITSPTDASCCTRRSKAYNRLTTKRGVRLRQSCLRIAKAAAMMEGRYAHAKQFRRHRKQLRILRSHFGRIIRDIRRRIHGQKRPRSAPLTASCAADPLSRRSSATWAAATSKVALEVQPTSSARFMLRPSQTSRQ